MRVGRDQPKISYVKEVSENKSTFHRLSQSNAGMTFFFVWQAEFGMCFDVAPSAYRSVHAASIFRSFELSPWHVAVWKWLLEKHPIAQQAFFAIEYRPRPKESANESSTFLGRFSRFLSLKSKLSSLNRRNQSLHVVSDKALSP